MYIRRFLDGAKRGRLDPGSDGAPRETTAGIGEGRAPTAQAGAPDFSLDEFYQVYAGRAYGLAARLLPDDRETAENIVVETVVEIRRSLPRDTRTGTEDLERAILLVVCLRCLDVIRSREAIGHRATPPAVLSDVGGLGGRDGGGRTRKTIRDELAVLSSDQRTTIELAFFRGRTSTQIAEDLGIPKSTVHQAMRDGLRSLRDGLGRTD